MYRFSNYKGLEFRRESHLNNLFFFFKYHLCPENLWEILPFLGWHGMVLPTYDYISICSHITGVYTCAYIPQYTAIMFRFVCCVFLSFQWSEYLWNFLNEWRKEGLARFINALKFLSKYMLTNFSGYSVRITLHMLVLAIIILFWGHFCRTRLTY